MVTSSVGINIGSFCAKYDRYHINRIPQFMSEDDFCSKGHKHGNICSGTIDGRNIIAGELKADAFETVRLNDDKC